MKGRISFTRCSPRTINLLDDFVEGFARGDIRCKIVLIFKRLERFGEELNVKTAPVTPAACSMIFGMQPGAIEDPDARPVAKVLAILTRQ